MPLPRRTILLSAALAAAALAGCSIGDDGPQTTQTRDVAAFTRLDNQDSVDVRLHVGEPQSVRVLAGEKVIDRVGTEVRDGTLHLTFDRDGLGGDDVIVEASVPKLTDVKASGSGDIDVDGIDQEAFAVLSDGSADITLEGTAGRIELDVDGSGDVDLADLTARDAEVFVGGSGDVDVRADDRLEVSVDGSGDVRYHGDPALTQHLDGSGDLSQVN
jgi:hypothetical protein